MSLVNINGQPIGKQAAKHNDPQRIMSDLIRNIEDTRAKGHDALFELLMKLWRDSWHVQYDPSVPANKVKVTVQHDFHRPVGDGMAIEELKFIRCGEGYIAAIKSVMDVIPKPLNAVEEPKENAPVT